MTSASDRTTVVLLGDGEPMAEALRAALKHRRIDATLAGKRDAIEATKKAAPDLVVLVGDAAAGDGAEMLAKLAGDPATAVFPVALLSDDPSLDHRFRAFRTGAVAIVERTASVDAMATRITEIATEVPERSGHAAGEMGEATLEELVAVITKELRTGVLTVGGGGGGDQEAVRLVLGAGKPVAQAVAEFVERLKPLVAKAEPLHYEFHEEMGSRIGILAADEDTARGDAAVLKDLRVVIVQADATRADALAQELRVAGALVAVTDGTETGLDRARSMDPEIVVLDDTAGLEGSGYSVVRALRRDPRLRWASLLIAESAELWPQDGRPPDVSRFAARVAPLVQHDVALRERATAGEPFDTRLELTGPSRMIRSLTRVDATQHVTVSSPKASLEIDIANGLVVGATGKRLGREPADLEGTTALAALLALGSARVHVGRRAHPSTANIMLPVDEAVDAAAREVPPIKPSIPPPTILPDKGKRPVPPPPPAALRKGPTAKEREAMPTPAVAGTRPIGKPPVPAIPAKPPAPSPAAAVRPPPPAGPMAEPAAPRPPAPAAAEPSAGDRPTPPVPPPPTDSAETVRPPPGMLEAIEAEAAKLEEKKPAGAPSRAVRAKTMVGLAPPPVPSAPVIGGAPPPPTAAGPIAKRPDEITKEIVPVEVDVSTGETAAVPPADPPPRAEDRDSLASARTELALPISQLVAADGGGAPPVSAEPQLDAPFADPAEVHGSTHEHLITKPHEVDAPAVAPTPSTAPSRHDEETAKLHTNRPPPPKRGGATRWVVAVLVLAGAGAAAVVFVPGASDAVYGMLASLGVVSSEAAATEPPTPAGGAPSGTPRPRANVEPEAPVAEDPVAPTEAAPAEPEEQEAAQAEAEPRNGEPQNAEAAALGLPQFTGTEDERVSDQLVTRAGQLRAANRLDDARATYERALQFDPRNPHAMEGMGRVELAAGNARGAVGWAERAIRLRSRRAAYRVLLGDALQAAGDAAGARAAWRAALELDPQDDDARRRLGGAAEQQPPPPSPAPRPTKQAASGVPDSPY